MTRAIARTLLSHWMRHPVQLFTLLTGLALATGLWSAVQAINGEARASYARAASQMDIGGLPVVRGHNDTFPVSTYVKLSRAGWNLSAVLEGTLDIAGRRISVRGVDLLTYPPLPAVAAQYESSGFAPVDALTAPGLVFAHPDTAARLPEATDFPGIVSSPDLPRDLILTDIGAAETLLGLPGRVSYAVVLPDQPLGRPPLHEIASELHQSAPESRIDAAPLTDSFHLNLTAFGLLSFAVGLFIVHGTVGLAFAQRRGAIRTLRALGASLKFLTLMILGEILVLAMAGGLLGIALGYVVAGALLPDVAATLRGLYGAQVEGTLTLRPGWVLTGLAMSIAGTLVASLGALWRISRMPLLASAGQRAWGLNTNTLRLLLGAGVGLLVAGALAPVAVGDLAGGFMLMGGLLTGSALLLPAVLNKIIQIAQRYARNPVTEWIWADMRAQLPGLSLALMALLLALAANVGVGTMVSSFRLTFQGWLDQRLASEIYLTARDDEQGGAIASWLGGRADAVLPIRAVELDHTTGPVFLYGIVDHDTYRANWPLIAQGDRPWARLAEGTGILINEQLARRHEIWPGDRFAAVPDWPMTVVGVYSDYGNPTGQAIVALDPFLARFPEVQNRRFGIRVAPDDSDTLVADLHAAFDLPSGAVIRQGALKQQSMTIFEKTFLVTAALNVLTLGVAGFAIFTSLLTLWSQRLPQVAPIWALGMTRSNIARLELLRSLVLTSLTALLALPLGLVLAWALLAVVNVEAFGWRLPMHLFPGDWIKLLTLALIAGAAAAALPAYRLSRLPPASLLRVFADER